MELVVAGIGIVVGVLYGVFGAGASAFATPALALAGIPSAIAVASPLPATLPAALTAAWSYARRRELHWPTVRLALAGGLPATVAGALCSSMVGSRWLLVLSGAFVALLGARLVRPATHRPAGSVPVGGAVVVGASAGIGFFAGLLANGGGFMLVPLFLLLVGLSLREAAGTSLVTTAVLSVPTIAAHWLLGSIDWGVAGMFALGLVPGSLLGARLATRLPAPAGQRAFGGILLGFGAWFLLRMATG